MSVVFAVHNCPTIEICSQKWENLYPTVNPGIRKCGECKKEVVLCEDREHFDRLEAAGVCVGYKCYTERDQSSGQVEVSITVGIPKRS